MARCESKVFKPMLMRTELSQLEENAVFLAKANFGCSGRILGNSDKTFLKARLLRSTSSSVLGVSDQENDSLLYKVVSESESELHSYTVREENLFLVDKPVDLAFDRLKNPVLCFRRPLSPSLLPTCP